MKLAWDKPMASHNIKRIILSACLTTACFAHAAEPTPAQVLSCSNTAKAIQNVQKKQYELKSSEEGSSQNLFELQKEYDALLAEASIVKKLNELNRSFFELLSNQGDPIKDIASHIDRVKNSENLKVLKNMAVMDGLMKELSEDTGLQLIQDDGQYVDISDIMVACVDKVSVLCKALNDENDKNGNSAVESTTNLINSFLMAYAANSSGISSTERDQKLAAYRAILKNDISPKVDLEGIYNSANELSIESAALDSLKSFDSIDQDLLSLKKIRCCNKYPTFEEAQNETNPDGSAGMCVGIASSATDRKCDEVLAEAQREKNDDNSSNPGSLSNRYTRLANAFNNYESRTYNALNFKFNGIKNQDSTSKDTIISVPSKSAFGRFFASIGLASDEGDIRTEKRNKVIDSTITQGNINHKLNLAIDDIKCAIKSSYRRGKIQDQLNLNNFFDSSLGSSASSSTTNADDIRIIVEKLNASICRISNAKNNTSVDCEGSEAQNKYVRADATGLEIEISNQTELLNLFDDNSENSALAQDMATVKAALDKKKAEIDQVRNSNSYQYLDQIKSFFIADLKNRCSQDAAVDFEVGSCIAIESNNNLDYLVANVEGIVKNSLLAEIDSDTLNGRNYADANLAQKRIILGNMNGACIGLENMKAENPSIVTSDIENACKRISGLNSNAQKKTDSERNQETVRKYGSIDSEGRGVRVESTGKSIARGLMAGLPTAANNVATPFFSGLALRNSLPYQEQYWKQYKFNQYAQNWWYEQSQQFPPMMPYYPGYSPYYGTPGGYSSGYNFNQGGLTSIP